MDIAVATSPACEAQIVFEDSTHEATAQQIAKSLKEGALQPEVRWLFPESVELGLDMARDRRVRYIFLSRFFAAGSVVSLSALRNASCASAFRPDARYAFPTRSRISGFSG